MFAVIKTGGKQYKVEQNSIIHVETIKGDIGRRIEFKEILMVGGGMEQRIIGSPIVNGACVVAEIVAQVRGPKILIFKKKRRKNYRRKGGHKQDLTMLKIVGIEKV